jgi:hypothetical protein
MATMTYATLTQDLKDWMENDGTEFSNETDNFISLAEQRISRDIEPYAFHESATTTFNVGDRFVSKPNDAKIIFHFLYLDSDSKRIFLEERTDEFIYDYWPTSSTTGTPVYWANYNDTSILVAPTPSAALTIEMTYARRLTELSSSNTTNWLTKNAQDLILYGALMEACTFSKNREDLAIYTQRYQAAVEAINNQTRRRRRDDYSSPSNVMGENTLKPMST